VDYYRFFPLKFRDKTLSLDPYQDGCYRRLIDEYMITRKPLPNNDAALARICGISLQDWGLHACSMLVAFFQHSDGMLFQRTCDEELAFQDTRTKFHSEKAKKAAKIRWSKNKKLDATSMPVAMLGDARVESRELRENVESVLFTDNTLPKKKKFDPFAVPLPAWLPLPVWKDWIEHRKSVKKPLTERACSLTLGQLADFQKRGHNPVSIINTSIQNGWQGLFEPKPNFSRKSVEVPRKPMHAGATTL
jgi:uncharacterized protein YdaU (DUF1376 family)